MTDRAALSHGLRRYRDAMQQLGAAVRRLRSPRFQMVRMRTIDRRPGARSTHSRKGNRFQSTTIH